MIGHRAVVGIALEHLAPLIKTDKTEEILHEYGMLIPRTLRKLRGPCPPPYRPRSSTMSHNLTVVAPAPDSLRFKRSKMKHG